jgi:multisubunit Na+/H+ antiporter MnhE subunit
MTAARFLLFWVVSWLVAAAVWMVLVDTTYLPELLTGVVAAAIAASGSEFVREQRIAQVRPSARWLLPVWRPILRVPVDIALLTGVVLRQLVRRDREVGGLRAIPFSAVGEDPGDQARRALAEGVGSFAPNTVVIGIDAERKLLIAHQLVHTKDAHRSLDPLELG